MSRVLVAGGRGFMGRRVMRLLRESLPDIEVLTAGRNQANDRRLDVRAPQADALAGVDVLINTAGPFDYDPTPLVRACIAAGVHYIDLAETKAFIAAAGAVSAETAVVPGCSSVPGLIQVFASRFVERADVLKIRAQLSIGTNNPGSATLLYSMLAPIGRSGCFKRAWLRQHEGLKPRRYGNYPGGVPSIRTDGQDIPLEFGFGFDRRAYTRALRIFAPVIGILPRVLLRLDARLMTLCAPLLRPFGTRIGILSIDALDDSGHILEGIEIRAERNGLDIPALPSVWATEALLARPTTARNLAELMTPEAAEEKLFAAGYRVLRSVSKNNRK